MRVDWKLAVRRMLDDLPDDCDLEEIAYGLYTLDTELFEAICPSCSSEACDEHDVWSGGPNER